MDIVQTSLNIVGRQLVPSRPSGRPSGTWRCLALHLGSSVRRKAGAGGWPMKQACEGLASHAYRSPLHAYRPQLQERLLSIPQAATRKRRRRASSHVGYGRRIAGFGITYFLILALCALLGSWLSDGMPEVWAGFAGPCLITLAILTLTFIYAFRKRSAEHQDLLDRFHGKSELLQRP